MFEYKIKTPVLAFKAVEEQYVQAPDGKRKIRKGQWYVVNGRKRAILNDSEFKKLYEPANIEAKIHMETPDRYIAGAG